MRLLLMTIAALSLTGCDQPGSASDQELRASADAAAAQGAPWAASGSASAATTTPEELAASADAAAAAAMGAQGAGARAH